MGEKNSRGFVETCAQILYRNFLELKFSPIGEHKTFVGKNFVDLDTTPMNGFVEIVLLTCHSAENKIFMGGQKSA